MHIRMYYKYVHIRMYMYKYVFTPHMKFRDYMLMLQLLIKCAASDMKEQLSSCKILQFCD